MHYLALRVIFTLCFTHLLRYAQGRTPRPLWAMGINYLVASALCVGWVRYTGWQGADSRVIGLGVLAGVTYVTSLLFFLPAIRASGISIAGTVLQLSMMIPVGVSMLRHDEMPSNFQWLGIVVTMAALPLLTLSRAVESPRQAARFSPWVVWLFLSSGIAQTTFKELQQLGLEQQQPLFSLTLFAIATPLTLVCSAIWERKVPAADGQGRLPWLAREWVVGSLMGTMNVSQLWLLLLALGVLPAIVVFPVSACLGMGLNAVVAMILWGERPPPGAWLGIALAIGAVALLNF